MASVEDLLLRIVAALINKPSRLIVGITDGIHPGGKRLTQSRTPITEVVSVKVRTMPTGGTYIALGDETEQPYRLTAVGQELLVDFIDDLSKVVAVTDAGTDGVLEWIGG